MKLLFDQNISYRLVRKVFSAFPESAQVKEMGLYDKSDIDIWEYAKAEGYTIVTFDTDFYDYANLYGHPPKIIWLRVGNTSTDKLAEFLLRKSDIIRSFIENIEYRDIACLEL